MSNLNSTQKRTRLDLIDRGLDRAIKAFDIKKTKSTIQTLAAYIKDKLKTDDSVNQICADYLSKGETVPKELLDKFRNSVENLDDEYLTASDNFDKGLTNEEKVISSFSTARIASSLLWATETDPHIALAEMIYEAHASLQNLDQLKQLVLSVE